MWLVIFLCFLLQRKVPVVEGYVGYAHIPEPQFKEKKHFQGPTRSRDKAKKAQMMRGMITTSHCL